MNATIECNVVILPSEPLAAKAMSVSTELSKQGALFTLETGKFYPHASVYMLKLKIEDLEAVKAQLAKIASDTPALNLKATKYNQSRGYLDVEYQKPEQLDTLQQHVVAALNPLRSGMRDNDIARLPDATGLALENFQNYGWNSIGELYRPHLTLTRFTDEQTVPANLPELSELSGTFMALGLFEMGSNGTCVRELASWQLVQ